MSAIRLYVPPPLNIGLEVELDDAQGHYLTKVMRRSKDDPIELFDGQSGGFAGRIVELGKRRVRIGALEKIRDFVDPGNRPILFQAVIKRPRLEWLVEKAVELDVGGIVFVRTHRTSTPLCRLNRLQTIAIEAAEQSGRLDIPPILGEVALANVGPLRRRCRTLLMLDPQAERGAAEIVSERQGDLDLLVGPEGGFSLEDDAMLKSMPSVMRGKLASTTLRAETAALAAVSACAILRHDPLRQTASEDANGALSPGDV